MNITISEENVMPFRKVAEELARQYGWLAFDTNDRKGEIYATTAQKKLVTIDVSGFAYADGETEPSDEDCVNFCEDLDYPDVVWATDADGNYVLLHN